jgi:predicted O-methyltransferase YrrM
MTDLATLDGWLATVEGERLTALASTVPAGQVIVELGSYRGKSSCYLAAGSHAGNHVPVYCVDLWELGGQWETDVERRPGGALHHDDPAHHEAFRVNTEPFRDVIREVQADSLSAARVVNRRCWWWWQVGLLFIDADHRYEATKANLNAWTPHMAPGGWVVIHDYANGDYPGVRQAVDEWLPVPFETATLTASMLAVRV